MKAAPDTSTRPATPRALQQDAHAWVRRLTSGEATVADAQALQRWCEASPAHASAFAEARRLWRDLGPAGEMVRARAASAATHSPRMTRMSRRWFLGGALASAAGVGAAVVAPAGFWGSMTAMAGADYRTATGEQRQIAMGEGVTLDLNTRTSIAMLTGAGPHQGVDLLDGEIAVDNTGSAGNAAAFVVEAGKGRVTGTRANFEVRHLASQVCVTCVSGNVGVSLGSQRVALAAQQQVTYEGQRLGAVTSVDTTATSAWRNGVLVFRDTPLVQVADEINRYRNGRVVVFDNRLAQSRLSGRYRIDRLGEIFAQIQEVLGARVTHLPGGIVLVG
ncbi:FecR family protein [Pandoraea iniqua]|uniref:FecR family protein n=1 Tax=Pandoraea iniqua TaxID=2508288 RepID=UPI001581ADF4|nr:FecR domain-containing protein [Pandoraea iniqua]